VLPGMTWTRFESISTRRHTTVTAVDGLEPARGFGKKRSMDGPVDENCDGASERGVRKE
jgi:hypothetical protein